MVPCSEKKVQYLIPLRAREVTGVDVDRVQIKSALEEVRSRGMSGEIGFLINDARDFCFRDSSLDVVTMLAVLTLVSKSDRQKNNE
jgi:ubiquinone/menaquinone biosynthesis C-methylase UbiE